MAGRDEPEASQPRVPRGLTLEEARELGRGNTILQLQKEVQTLSSSLAEILAKFREDPGGGGGRPRVPPRDVVYSENSSSSQDEFTPRGRRRPTRTNEDDMRDMKFDPPDFDGNLNPDAYLEWIQTIERYFEVKGYSDEKSFKIAILKLKKYASLWYENTKKQRAREGKPRIHSWSKLKKLLNKRFLPEGYKRDLYLRVSSLTQGRMSVEEYIREFEQLKIRSGIDEEQEQAVVRRARSDHCRKG